MNSIISRGERYNPNGGAKHAHPTDPDVLIRQVGTLLATLKAPYIVLADAQSPQREKLAGRVPADGSQSLKAGPWHHVAEAVSEAAVEAGVFSQIARKHIIGR